MASRARLSPSRQLRRSVALTASLLACTCISVACGGAPAGDPADPTRTSADASRSTSAFRAKLVGEWLVTLPPEQARQHEIVRCALAEPPAEDELARITPTPSELESFRNVVKLRRTEPDSPLLAKLKRKMAEIDAIRVSFTVVKMIGNTEAGTSVEEYRVDEDLPDGLVLTVDGPGAATTRRAIIRFVDDDNIVLTKGATRIPFHRKGTGVTLPAATATEPPSRSRPDPSATASPPAASANGMDDFDRCTKAYFACVSRMPPEAQSAMGPSLALMRKRMEQVSKTPEDRASFAASCKDAMRTITASGMCDRTL